MAAISVKPAGGDDRAGAGDQPRPADLRISKVLGSVPDPRVHRSDHHVLLDVAAAVPAHGPRHVVPRDRDLRVGAEPDRHGAATSSAGCSPIGWSRRPARSIADGRSAFTCAFGLGALSMTMPFVTNDYLAVVLMGLALFGNQWVAATYIGAVGDVVPQQLAGRVNGIAGLGDNGAALLAVLSPASSSTSTAGRRCSSARACCHSWRCERVPRAAEDRAGEVRFPWGKVLNTDAFLQRDQELRSQEDRGRVFCRLPP